MISVSVSVGVVPLLGFKGLPKPPTPVNAAEHGGAELSLEQLMGASDLHKNVWMTHLSQPAASGTPPELRAPRAPGTELGDIAESAGIHTNCCGIRLRAFHWNDDTRTWGARFRSFLGFV